ncbi:glutaminase A [Silvanigrella aquatica]|uniref:Glutaminase n=1 Tax=Silvanigrella aquatica TaxID=1915309 RepID=A0A1L4D0R4_9BACT|nr:glutaminase A [Silvanigrella aquatica]APJ03791.1 glutaminase A [Silvanigrella aquatica]
MKKSNFVANLSLVIISATINFSIHAADAAIDIKKGISESYQKFKGIKEGKNADYIPDLAKVNPSLFSIAIATVDGKIESIGDAETTFSIQSISKPLIYGLALKDNGEKLNIKVGLNATGQKFNSIQALESTQNHIQNPMVNAGAIQVTSFVKGKDSNEKWQKALNFVQQLAEGKSGEKKPYFGEAVYKSESSTNLRNKAISDLLNAYGMMGGDPLDALDRYTKACSIMITTKQLAMIGATLANQGTNPITKKNILQTEYVKDVVAEMSVNGLYETSGEWWVNVGVASKSGVGGGILAVIPNKMAIAVFSPPLDGAGNSVKAQEVIKYLSKNWKLHFLDLIK